MAPSKLPEQVVNLLKNAKSLARELELKACLMMVDRPVDFKAVKRALGRLPLIISSDEEDVLEKAKKAGLTVVPLQNEPETRQLQISQALLEAIADDLLQAGDRIVAVYSGFERDNLDSISVINLTEHLARLTSRDLQRLETQVPLEVLRIMVDLAVEIGSEGREGKKVGALFVVGNHRKAISMSHEQV